MVDQDNPARASGPLRGAVVAERGGREVVVHYGSVAGELAACLRHVGIAERTDLRVLEVTGSSCSVATLAARHSGRELAVGGSARAAGCWWARPGAERVVIYVPRRNADQVARILRADASHHPGATVATDRGGQVQLGIFGRLAPALLELLGAYGPTGDRRQAAPAAAAELDGVPVTWLLEADDQAVASVGADAAPAAIAAIERVGRPLGLASVGEDALTRWSLVAGRRRPLTRPTAGEPW